MRNRLRQMLAQNLTAGRPIAAVKNATGDGIEVSIYDVIDPWFGVSAASFKAAIAGAGDAPLTVRINSPGGDVFDGRAIANMIAQHPGPTTCIVDGLAASSASTIAVAAQKTVMADGSMLMVHNAWIMALDNAAGLRQAADVLDKIDRQIAADYARKAKCTLDEALAWMAAETWFPADEAVTAGLADEVLAVPAKMQNFNLGAFDRAPQDLLDRIAAAQKPEPNHNFAAMRAAAERRLRLFDHIAA